MNNPKNANIYFDAAKEYDKVGRHEEAIEFYTKTIEEDMNFKSAYLRRAMLYENRGETEKTIEDYKKVMELDKTDTYPAERLADIYHKLGNRSESVKYDAEVAKRKELLRMGIQR